MTLRHRREAGDVLPKKKRYIQMRTYETSFADPAVVAAMDDDPREGPDALYPAHEFACLDANECANDGGCIYLTSCGVTRCIYCGTVVA